MSDHRNRHRNKVGLGGIFPVLVWGCALVVVYVVFVMVQQRMGDSRRRVEAMHREMQAIDTALLSIRSQQDAMMTRESLRQRLQSTGLALEPIPLKSIHYITDGRREEKVAMESRQSNRADLPSPR